MLIYPIELEPDTNETLLVTFPDVPEAATFGKDEADAKVNAVGAPDCHVFSLHGRPGPNPHALCP